MPTDFENTILQEIESGLNSDRALDSCYRRYY